MKQYKHILAKVYNEFGTIVRKDLPILQNVDDMTANHMWYLIEARYRDYLTSMGTNPQKTCLKIMFVEPDQAHKEYYPLPSGPLPMYRTEGAEVLRVVMKAEGQKITRLYGP